MPEINNTFQIKNVDKDSVLNLCKESLETIGGQKFNVLENEGITILSSVIPSMAGWGGMRLDIEISQRRENTLEVTARGYIAQLATSPLTKKIDKFMEILSEKLKSNYNFDLEFIKQKYFFNIPNIKFNKTDKGVFILIIIVSFVTSFIGIFLRANEIVLAIPVLLLGYFLADKYIFKSKE